MENFDWFCLDLEALLNTIETVKRVQDPSFSQAVLIRGGKSGTPP